MNLLLIEQYAGQSVVKEKDARLLQRQSHTPDKVFNALLPGYSLPNSRILVDISTTATKRDLHAFTCGPPAELCTMSCG